MYISRVCICPKGTGRKEMTETTNSAYKTFRVHYWLHLENGTDDKDYYTTIRAKSASEAHDRMEQTCFELGSHEDQCDDFTLTEITPEGVAVPVSAVEAPRQSVLAAVGAVAVKVLSAFGGFVMYGGSHTQHNTRNTREAVEVVYSPVRKAPARRKAVKKAAVRKTVKRISYRTAEPRRISAAERFSNPDFGSPFSGGRTPFDSTPFD